MATIKIIHIYFEIEEPKEETEDPMETFLKEPQEQQTYDGWGSRKN
jgi:hypothetical protein